MLGQTLRTALPTARRTPPLGLPKPAMRGSATQSARVRRKTGEACPPAKSTLGAAPDTAAYFVSAVRSESRYRAASAHIDGIKRLAMQDPDGMNSLPERIMEYAEATPIQAADFLHLSDRVAMAWWLARWACSERILRICRGVYMRSIQTRFGLRAARLRKALASQSALWGEIIVPEWGPCGQLANWLGLTTQNTRRSVYLTSGPNRLLNFGTQAVALCHAPAWQLTAPHGAAGVARFQQDREEFDAVMTQLSEEYLSDRVVDRTAVPAWKAVPIGRLYQSVGVWCMHIIPYQLLPLRKDT